MDNEVCIIGSGFSGLAVANELRRRNIPFTCVDRSAEIGGVWQHSQDLNSSPAYRALHLNTSSRTTAFHDFPMPADYPRYPGLRQVSEYLCDFAAQRDLKRDVELRTEVVSARQNSDLTWDVVTRDESGAARSRRFRNVVVATGQHWRPRFPDPPIAGADTFGGRVLHSFGFSDAAAHAGERVLVLGIGNSACDIAVELSRAAEKTFLAIRHGAHIVPKQLMGIPVSEISDSDWWGRMSFQVQRSLIERLLQLIRGDIRAYGIPEPDHRIFSRSVTISDELLPRITNGGVIPKPMIDRFEGDLVHFTDGSSERIDAVVHCTGYELEFPFLPAECVFTADGSVGLYQRVVAPRHPGLYFAGLIKPVGSVTRSVESQSVWIADLVESSAALPSGEVMAAEIDEQLRATRQRYGKGGMNSIQVDVASYLKALEKERAAGRRRARTG
ncbi:flavin-containing monooxygenase [Saccharopolyspora taberi]|uniref:flavin-containing monooxygenase n=1 Tax=Saccharopolyspora taberi TaxID=60895 RepID=UPI0031CE7921